MRSAVTLAIVIAALGFTAQAADQEKLEGTILETLDVSGYTYVRLETTEGEVWAAVPSVPLEVGNKISIANPQAMGRFESKALGRTFEEIYFGTLPKKRTSPPLMTSGANPHGSASTAEKIAVQKASGPTGRTVAEVYATKGDLDGKVVSLRGKVVKFSEDILGRNWIHLRDGSGDAATGTHDITVTTSATAAVGEVILIEGTVGLDRDFGSGYRYAVIVEDARIKENS
ncbi:MAG: hypothetical protein GTN89_16135 [Acidobacteria bacterium]|nr:hypothetical protein [Acidobacteriota bacterium]NIM62640.1 hypothetical protein [Acidobacteriota bacterium]NIO60758.1 hypothetical protein [Acidobacteriota bacterium]NIQ31829.1 hypothetical protein [Acidobacteriota bacterium]NIQ87156.1 hypothetical protein [Acidobacteriota bacterium]